MVRSVLAFLVFFILCAAAPLCGAVPIVGTWQFKNDQMEVTAKFMPDGTFHEVTVSGQGRQVTDGRFQMAGATLLLTAQGQQMPLSCRFEGRIRPSSPILTDRPCNGAACDRGGR